MPSVVRTLLLLSAIPLSFGCDDAEDSPIKRPSGTAGTADVGTGGTPAMASGGSAGLATAGGSGASAAGSGGDASMAGGSSTGGASAMAGAAGSSGGVSAAGGTGGEGTGRAGSGMTAGMSSGGTGTGSSGSNPCAAGSAAGKTFGGHCYLLVTNAKSFQAARNDCMSKQGHLVTISNGEPPAQETFDAEDTFVYGLAGGKDTWLGLTDGKMDRDPGDGTFYKWITGEASPLEAWGTGYGWQSGEPNNYAKSCMNGDSCYEHCGFMVSDQGDKWNDDLCEATKPYICEWDSLVAPQ